MNFMFNGMSLVEALATSGSIEIKDVITLPYKSNTWDMESRSYNKASIIIEKMTKGIGWYYVFAASDDNNSALALYLGLLYYDGSRIWGNLDGLYTNLYGYFTRYSYNGIDDSTIYVAVSQFAPTTTSS